ncbi:MAG: glucosamine-6-phosphate deaminase [Eubacteriales bacterium]|nr:glucosamine-6-phosphate deaminase [Eubacteriales bacterium]
MRIIIAKDYADMSRKGANIIAAQVLLKANSVLGLATGSTPVGAYAELIQKYENGELSFAEVSTINLDEYRGLAEDNDQSYRYFMNEKLFNHVDINKANTHVPNGLEKDAQKACEDYDALIASYGGIDLQLLGLGLNGHIGFNEPADHFPIGTNCVDLTASTIEANSRFFENLESVPKQAYTMGVQAIMQADCVLMLVNGKAKANIVKQAFFGPVTPQVPASILQLHKNFILIADEEALSALE